MSKRSSSVQPQEFRWRITRIKWSPATFLSYVQALDEKTANERVAAEFQVRPELVDRLVARRAG